MRRDASDGSQKSGTYEPDRKIVSIPARNLRLKTIEAAEYTYTTHDDVTIDEGHRDAENKLTFLKPNLEA